MKLAFICILLISSDYSLSKTKVQDKLSAYGKLSVMTHVEDNDASIEDSGSRVGLKAHRVLVSGVKVSARGEWSFNAVNNTSTLSIGDNQNFLSSDANKTFSRRLGYLSFDLKSFGVFRVGKQWSVYSDVSHFTDNFNLYGGSSGGTYNLRTDGGQSGTGRVSQAVTYRNSFWGIQYGLQAKLIKNRKLTVDETDVSIVAKDAYGFSAKRTFFKDMFEFGIAYNQIDLKGEKDAITGYDGGNSWSSVVGLKLKINDLLLAYIYNRSKNHEIDDQTTIFDGNGQELLVSYSISKKLILKTGMNYLSSFESDLKNDYKKEHYIIGLSYNSIKEFKLFIEGRLNESLNAAGEKSKSSLGIGGILYF
jgi:predicted porin